MNLRPLGRLSALWTLGVVGAAPLLQGGMIRHDVDLAEYRALAAQPDFDSVGRYVESPGSEGYATGVLVAPRWVLTASHFLGEKSVWIFGEETYQGMRVIRHPKYVRGETEAQWTGWDMALVELDRPVSQVAPATRYRGRDEVGAVITKVGYGYQGDGKDGLATPLVQMRLAGRNMIEAAGGSLGGREFTTDVLVFDFDGPDSGDSNPFGSTEPLPLEIGGSKGDSGGGVFIRHDGEWQLAGIVSGALNRQIKYGAIASIARVSSANDWIDSVINASPGLR